jgi:hypothetical protein
MIRRGNEKLLRYGKILECGVRFGEGWKVVGWTSVHEKKFSKSGLRVYFLVRY